MNAYVDARLRELADSWVVFEVGSLSAPDGITLAGDLVVGYLYVDQLRGFLVRAECEATFENGVWARGQDLGGVVWDLAYEEIKALRLKELRASDCQTLGLPTRPPQLSPRFHSAIDRCRRCVPLDAHRVPGHPDVVRVWVREGANLRFARILVRLEEEVFPQVYEGIVVEVPPQICQPETGSTVTFVALPWQAEMGLFYVWQANSKGEETPINKGENVDLASVRRK